MDISLTQGVVLLLIGIVAAWLGLSGRVRYLRRLGCAVIVLIFAGLYAIVSNLFK